MNSRSQAERRAKTANRRLWSGVGAAPGIAAASYDALRVVLFALTVLTVSRVHMHFPAVAAVRPAFLLALVAGAYILLNPASIAPANVRTWPAQALVALAVIACLSVPFGIAMGRSARFLFEEYSTVLIFAALLIVAIRSARDLFLLVWAYVIGCAILAWTSIFVFDVSEAPGGVLRLSHLHTYDANDAGLVLTVGVPLTLLTLHSSRTAGRILSGLTLIGIAIALARTGSRGAFIGVLAVGIALLLSWRHVSALKRLGAAGAIALVLVVAAPPGYWTQMKTLANPTEDYNWDSINGRRAVTLRGIGYMLDHPLFGVGIHNFERAEGTISEKAKERHPAHGIRWTAPHNSFVQIGAELGIPGLLVWSCLIFGGLVTGIVLRRRVPTEWRRGDREERFLFLCTVNLPVAFLAFAVTSSFLSFAYLDPAYILVAYHSGLYAALGTKGRRANGGTWGAWIESRPEPASRGRQPQVAA